ncbi:HlyD family secretion protein [Volucribacter psittacicida]|uniref:HlyD family secretion protein n=1 Tax=Volucribacter psittacicida TaxID=203482 RepID=A0A4R1FUB2_9PAST|nr:HlyD family efflux transporter periplasmic adaptor subunit [Volucribacter psittacicida]TCJ98926.1 HlyD family secretion protein [Volucribacter psittacicida]
MKKLILIVLLVIIGAGVVYWLVNRNADDLPPGISAMNGRLTVERIDVASLYAGRVEQVYVDEGENVEKDQPLVRLSDSQVMAKLAQAQAGKKQAEQAVERANAQELARQQQLDVAKLEWTNAQQLRKDKLISSTELERREAAYQAAQAELSGAKAAKAEAEAYVLQAQAQIDEVADIHQDLIIKSPLAGRVEYRLVEMGNVIGAGAKVVSLLDLEDVYINIFLPAPISNQVKLNDDARILVDGMDKAFPAKVVYVAANAQFTPKSVETAEERTKLMFKIKLQIPREVVQQHSSLLKGGMTAMGYVKYQAEAEWPETLR